MKNEYYEVDVTTGCHVWKRATANGYGRMFHNGRLRPAHRVFWEAVNGSIPTGKCLDHLCRNRRCVNPAHLEVVTQEENVHRGTLSKFTEQDVIGIRTKYANGARVQILAHEFGVTRTAIRAVIRGRVWKNAGGPIAPPCRNWPQRIKQSEHGRIKSLSAGGLSYAAIGSRYGVSKQRIHQILSGVSSDRAR